MRRRSPGRRGAGRSWGWSAFARLEAGDYELIAGGSRRRRRGCAGDVALGLLPAPGRVAAAVGLDVEEGGAVEAVEAADDEGGAIAAVEADHGGADGVGADGGAEGEGAAGARRGPGPGGGGRGGSGGASRGPRGVAKASMPSRAASQGASSSRRHSGPSSAPWLGHVRAGLPGGADDADEGERGVDAEGAVGRDLVRAQGLGVGHRGPPPVVLGLRRGRRNSARRRLSDHLWRQPGGRACTDPSARRSV